MKIVICGRQNLNKIPENVFYVDEIKATVDNILDNDLEKIF